MKSMLVLSLFYRLVKMFIKHKAEVLPCSSPYMDFLFPLLSD